MNKKSWVERFRPTNINSVVQQDEIIALLKNAFETKTLTHMLLYGPPGTAKTTIANIISRKFYQISDDINSDIIIRISIKYLSCHAVILVKHLILEVVSVQVCQMLLVQLDQ